MMGDRRYGGESRVRSRSPPQAVRDYSPRRRYELEERSTRVYNRPRNRDSECSPGRGSQNDRLRRWIREYSPQRGSENDRLRSREHEYSPQRSSEYDRPRMQEREYLASPRHRGGEYDTLRGVVDRNHLPAHCEVEGIHGGEHERLRMRGINYSPRRHLVEERLGGEYLHEPERLKGMYDRRPDVGDRGREYNDGLSRSLRPSGYDGADRGGVKGGDAGISRSIYQFNESLSHAGSTSSKFQWNHLLHERGKTDGVKGSNDFGISSAGVSSERDYFTKRYLDSGPSELLCESTPTSLEAQKGRGYSSSYPLDVSVPQNSFGLGDSGGCTMTSSYLGNSLRKTEDLHGDPYLDNRVGGMPLMREDNPLNHLKDEYGYVGSSSQPKAFASMSSDAFKEEIPPSLREGHHIHSDGVTLSSGMLSKPLVYDGYGEMSLSRSPMDPAGLSSDFRNFMPSSLNPSEEKHRNYAYPIVARSEGFHFVAGSGDIHGNPGGVVEEYSLQDMPRTSSLDPVIDRLEQFSHREHLKDSRPWHPHSHPHDYVDTVGSSNLRKQDVDVLGYGDTRFEYKREVIMNYGNNQYRELDGYGIDGGPWPHQNRSDMLTSRDDGSPSQRVSPGGLRLPEPSKNMLKCKRITGRKSSMPSSGLNLSSTGRSGRNIYDEEYVDELYRGDDLDTVTVSKKSKFTRTKYGKTAKEKVDLRSRLTFQNASQSIPSLLSNVHKSAGQDIKTRLGPSPQDVHPSPTVKKKFKSSLKKRLGPGPPKNGAPLPWLKKIDAQKLPRVQNGSKEGLHDQRGNSAVDNGTSSKPEPPENSEEFKQLVHSAFFKFVKLLNETPIKRRKYLEQGKAGNLKCIVCSSNSEEFEDTENLVIHALKCEKVGIRSQHFGLHKALCALMGWRSAEAPKNSWVREMLSDTETLALKEDLIMWPPAVIIHNSTIANEPDKRIIVSIEELEVKLRDMGFGDKTKVCGGRPANQSIMVVRFGATLSGLQDAERLHKIFVNTKRGRAELPQANFSNSGNSHESMQSSSGDQLQDFLYGYLGVAEDLDKLDFATKKRCLVKSKKEIEHIVDAPVKKGK